MRKSKKNIEEKEVVDLSLIKENDLDKTATFTDLLSRKERKQHKKNKDVDLKEIEDNIEDNSIEFKTEELSSQISESKTVEITEEEKQEIIKEAKLVDEDNEEDFVDVVYKKHNNIFNTIFISLLVMASIAAFVYAIIYTNFLEDDLYLLINGISLVVLVFNYCLMTINSNKAGIFFAIMNYLLIVAAITFNSLIFFKII
jgi:ABC-type multidrug transport system fused ATPase/permease subunit